MSKGHWNRIKGVYNGSNDNYIPMSESATQNYTHTCLSSFIVCTQSSHHSFQRYENFGQHTRVSLSRNSNEATLNCAFTVKNIICHAQLILLLTSLKFSMQLHSLVPICLNLSSLKNELLWMTCSNKYKFALECMATFRRLSREQHCRSVSRMLQRFKTAATVHRVPKLPICTNNGRTQDLVVVH